MSAVAAARQQLQPLFLEGSHFWKDLVSNVQQRVHEINRTAAACGSASDLLRVQEEAQLTIVKEGVPSTAIQLRLKFEPWGPVIAGVISGRQSNAARFSTEEFEVPLSRDLDGSVIAVFDEGRSFTANDLARYLLQRFRRCFPNLTLPC